MITVLLAITKYKLMFNIGSAGVIVTPKIEVRVWFSLFSPL